MALGGSKNENQYLNFWAFLLFFYSAILFVFVQALNSIFRWSG